MPILRQMRRTSASEAHLLGPAGVALASASPSISMLPPSTISRWLRQRRRMLLPKSEGPMTATTEPSRRVSDTQRSTCTPLKDLVMSLASIMISRSSLWAPGLFVESGIAFFHALEEQGEHQRHEQIEHRRNQEGGGGEVALHDATRGAQNIVQSKDIDERGVLHQGNGFIAHWRQHAAHHLWQDR